METTSILLALLISVAICAVLCLGSLGLGYWMGRNSSERPFRSDLNPKVHDQGGSAEPEDDPFYAAMALPEERIATIPGDE